MVKATDPDEEMLDDVYRKNAEKPKKKGVLWYMGYGIGRIIVMLLAYAFLVSFLFAGMLALRHARVVFYWVVG